MKSDKIKTPKAPVKNTSFLDSISQAPIQIPKKQEPSKGKFKRSGQLTDQILKYSYHKDSSLQTSIFDTLTDIDQTKITESGIKREEIVEGVKLTPSEQKIIDCLCKMLHNKSQTKNPEAENYYTGNESLEMTPWGDKEEQTPAPKLSFTLYELTKEYKGENEISGKDQQNVKTILTDLDNRRFLFNYKEILPKKDGGRYETTIQTFRKLIEIIKLSVTEYDPNDNQVSIKEDTVILLNPIFRRQIDTKYILYPEDINKRTIIAYGSHNISEITLRLRDYLMREISSKRYEPEISLDKLYYLLSEKWMKESRKKKVKEYTDKAIETVKAMGLLLDFEIKKGYRGDPKIIFHLNKDWE